MPQFKVLFFLICSFVSPFLSAQELLKLDYGCNFTGDTIVKQAYSFESDNEAETALKRVMKYTGLPTNFVIKAANVPNAQASILGKSRYILYNQLFMLRIKEQTNTDWAAISILAHEIGHHLSGHTLEGTGSRPEIELEADRFSGFILAKMGATLDQSLIAIKTISSEMGSTTHPPRSARIAAITNGWVAAQDLEKVPQKSNIPPPVTEKKPATPLISATIEDVWVEYNVFENEKKGMRIHTKFQTENMLGIEGRASAYFYFEDGTKLKDFNGVYCTTTGEVAARKDFTPTYNISLYKDLKIFMPYEELHMNAGSYDLKFYVALWEYSNKTKSRKIAESEYQVFNYSK